MTMRKGVKPNHTCKNLNCHKGEDGGPKRYYACNSCVRNKPAFWQEYCCSIECYEAWIEQMKEVNEGKILKREEPSGGKQPKVEAPKPTNSLHASLAEAEKKAEAAKEEKKEEQHESEKKFKVPFLHN